MVGHFSAQRYVLQELSRAADTLADIGLRRDHGDRSLLFFPSDAFVNLIKLPRC